MINWKSRYAQRTAWVTSTVLRDMLKLTQQTDIICFSGGLPAPELFPIERFQLAADIVLGGHGQQALQYSPTEGYSPLRKLVAGFVSRYGVPVDESNVIITAGSQQAMELIGRLLIDPDDQILVESPTYLGALQAFGIYHPEYVVVPTDGDGMVVDRLEPYLAAGPKFIYVLPNFQNPSGTTLPHERRIELVKLADSWGVPIVEDDPYRQLRYEGADIPSLVELGSQLNCADRGNGCYTGGVLYHSTFSKLLAPGLRIGWVVAPAEVIQQLAVLKQGVDLHTSTLAQMIAYEVARDDFFERHIRRLRQIYQHRRDVMLDALSRHMPQEATWTRPQGGLFILVTLPSGIDTSEVLADALKQHVAFVPGSAFFPAGGGENTLRLNYSSAKPDRIEEGIKRLGSILKDYCQAL
jgi:2-aminoadipate transaminase